MHETHQKDHFSRAVVSAVAAAAGVGATIPSYDQNSRDVLFTGEETEDTPAPELSAQLKCTSGVKLEGGDFSFHLRIKDYNRLRMTGSYIPRILIVVVVPGDPADWLLATSPDQIALRRCAYWRNLAGMPATPNTSTISINMSTSDVFDVKALLSNLKPPGETL